ncbi:MAG: uroporphyrinogen-III synthase [Pseudomonadales bacterium]|nr:uroporphyrinogen-III synthase [Pseudomonadales bacterium]MCP5184114.1 uroporphyrinogen-III synthase [Pseudomonadales bacterium]
MKIWITRSQPGASRLADAVRLAGYDPLVAPVIGIELLSVAVPERARLVIVLSGHAAALTRSIKSQLGFLAIGRKTADRVRAFSGQEVMVPETSDSEGVVAWLRGRLQALVGGQVVILAGEAGRETVLDWLRAQGMDALKIAAYRRRPMPVDVRLSDVGAVVLGSGDAVDPVRSAWVAAGGRHDVPMLVPSGRVANLARAAGFTQVVVCSGAGDDAVIEALRGVLPDRVERTEIRPDE